MRPLTISFATLALFLTLPVFADSALDNLARDVDRAESVRAVKTLQSSYAQYAQYGLWTEAGALFSPTGSFVFDGLIQPAQTAKGPAAIATFLRTRYGGGQQGLTAGSLSTMFIDAPVVNLSVDGNTAKARWQAIIFHGHDGKARIEGGVFENDYAREQGVWKIATAHYVPQYDGPYEEGWTNWGGGDLPVVPKHFDTDSAGIPIPPPTGSAPVTKATLAELQTRINNLNDEDRVRNLQSAYGFYQDRKMWDDVEDLFAGNCAVQITGQGIRKGRTGVRRYLETMGPKGLLHGQLNDRNQYDVTVAISPGGNEAFARGIELGMLGEADQEKGWWEVAVFYNRFVKENGVWKIRELRRFTLAKSDIFLGWGKSRLIGLDEVVMPAFTNFHPVTGKPIAVVRSAVRVAATPLTSAIAPSKPVHITIEEARRRLDRSAAYDGITNISATYGYYVDDSDNAGWANTMAAKGFKETPFSGYHIGRHRLIAARVRGKGPTTQAGISYHWLMQPMVLVSDDGRSATGRFRLFQPRTGKSVGKAGDFFGASFWGGMYHDRYVLENGSWKIWELTLDEPFITPVAWKDGVWAKAKDPIRRPPPATTPAGATPSSNDTKAKAKAPPANVDITLVSIGKREEHFSGGPGETLQWPSIMPMWFTYTNPVSGRIPELHQPDCVPCAQHPELRLDRNGYQEPPDAPVANRSR